MAELADALDLGSSTARCEGSSPFIRTSTSGKAINQGWTWDKVDHLSQSRIFIYTLASYLPVNISLLEPHEI